MRRGHKDHNFLKMCLTFKYPCQWVLTGLVFGVENLVDLQSGVIKLKVNLKPIKTVTWSFTSILCCSLRFSPINMLCCGECINWTTVKRVMMRRVRNIVWSAWECGKKYSKVKAFYPIFNDKIVGLVIGPQWEVGTNPSHVVPIIQPPLFYNMWLGVTGRAVTSHNTTSHHSKRGRSSRIKSIKAELRFHKNVLMKSVKTFLI